MDENLTTFIDKIKVNATILYVVGSYLGSKHMVESVRAPGKKPKSSLYFNLIITKVGSGQLLTLCQYFEVSLRVHKESKVIGRPVFVHRSSKF